MSVPVPVIGYSSNDNADGSVSIYLDVLRGAEVIVGTAQLRCDGDVRHLLARQADTLRRRSALAPHPLLEEGGAAALAPDQRMAVGALEAARLDALSRLDGQPLHGWLGGAQRRRLPVATTVRLDAAAPALAAALSERRARRFILASAEHDFARLLDSLGAAAREIAPDIEIALQLDGQFAPDALAALAAAARELRLAYVGDPCADAAAAAAAWDGATAPLALTAHRYPQETLVPSAGCGRLVVLADPVALGGVEAARRLATGAAEFGLLGDRGGTWGACLAAHLAAVLPVCTQPVIVAREAFAALRAEAGFIELGDGAGIDWT